MENTLQASFYALLEQDPGQRAVGFTDAAGDVAWRTREEFHERAAKIGAALADRGVARGDVCILVLPSDEFCATALAAVLLLGAVPLLIAPPVLSDAHSNLAQVLRHMLGKLRPRVVVCPSWMADHAVEFGAGRGRTRFVFGEAGLAGSGGAVTAAKPAETDVAALQLTSGTTGFPRVVLWKQFGVMAALRGMRAAMKLSAADVCFNWTPLYHDMGLVNNFFLCLASGVPLAVASPHDFVKRPAMWLRGMWKCGATVGWSPNFGFTLVTRRATDAELEGVRLDGIRGLWNAAERIHLETLLDFYERFRRWGLRREALKTNLGCAENVGGATFSDPDGAFVYERVDGHLLQKQRVAHVLRDAREAAGAITVVGVGRPVPGMRIRILSRTGRPLPDGHVGEIALKTPSRMAGYVGDARATRRALIGEWLRTGDLGYLRGEELFWIGRVRDRITVQGRKLDPSYFEPILARIEGLRAGCFVAFGVDDAQRGTQRIVIVSEVVQPLSRSLEAVRDEIRVQTFLGLGVEASETILVPAGTLTKTSSGKRRHRHFRRLYGEGRLQAFQVPEGPREEAPPGGPR
jgi:acyl-CoA synthetase (AMP-forming)/AMP-acid ligase II